MKGGGKPSLERKSISTLMKFTLCTLDVFPLLKRVITLWDGVITFSPFSINKRRVNELTSRICFFRLNDSFRMRY